MSDQKYVGEELTLFAKAKNWKTYYSQIIEPFFGMRVLEVGAGIGATTEVLANKDHSEWVCMEPDPDLLSVIQEQIANRLLPDFCKPKSGTIFDLPETEKYDSILYIDVLEHIQEDQAEVSQAGRLLSPGGHLIVLSPAYEYLYSPFDQAIGHFRRYDKKMMRDLTPKGLDLLRVQYLDSIGLVTSLGNKILLKQSYPTLSQILFWDQYLIPMAKIMDKLTAYSFGRSVLAVWIKNG